MTVILIKQHKFIEEAWFCPQEALDNLMLEGDNIVSAARRAIMRHDYSAVLTIFPILRHLKMNKSEFDSTLQVRTVVSARVGVGGRPV